MVQAKIDAAQLTVQGIAVSNTHTQNYTISINSTITTDGSAHATIDAFDGVMYLKDLAPHTPFATVHFPASDASAAVQVVNISQVAAVSDAAAFATFSTWLLANDSLRLTVQGWTTVHVAGLASRPYAVNFQKTIEMPGLARFNGTTVSNASIAVAGFGDGTNFRGTVTIPNRSLVSVEIVSAGGRATRCLSLPSPALQLTADAPHRATPPSTTTC